MLRNKFRLARRMGALSASLALLVLLAGCGGPKPVAVYKPAQNAKTVNVTVKEFDAFKGAYKLFNYSSNYAQIEQDPNFQSGMLKQYIALKIISGQATGAVQKDAESRANTEMQQLQQTLSSSPQDKAQVDALMKSDNFTMNDVKDYLVERAEAVSAMNAKFTEADIKKTYDAAIKANPNAYIDTATVRHILIATVDPSDPTGKKQLRTYAQALAIAQQVEAKLKAGGNFAALAKQYSDDPGSKNNGGELGKDQDINQYVPEFKNAVLSLPIGKISAPVKSPFGYHIIQVEDREKNNYATAKPKVEAQMASDYFNNFIKKDLPSLIVSTNLPKTAGATGGASGGSSSGAPSGKG